jgi:methylase of polypeptide subunit release factors
MPTELDLLQLPEELVSHKMRARYRLDFVEHLYLFSDWPSTAHDVVLAPGETAAILYRAARQLGHWGTSLDLGCGSGVLGLLLAAQSDRVIATDLNPRAIELTQLNAQLNGILNVECRSGSLFDPVADERFDLIVSQPPYIPHPPDTPETLFLHGGLRGDEVARELTAGILGHLTLQGRAVIFSDWPLRSGERLADRISHAGLRARLYASPPLTPESYARSYGDELAAHLALLKVDGVRQCLAVMEQGSGVEEIPVLPHQWLNLPVD